jgi:hypothetical protein
MTELEVARANDAGVDTNDTGEVRQQGKPSPSRRQEEPAMKWGWEVRIEKLIADLDDARA